MVCDRNRNVLASCQCPLCLNLSAAPYREIRNAALHRCSSCGLIFQNPLPSLSELEDIYGETYYESWGGEEVEELIQVQKKAYFTRHLRIIERIKPQGTLLDVGCAKGYFVDLALSKGYSAYGLEISEYAGMIASSTLGTERIQIGTIEDCSYSDGIFDVITMFDFLEHVPDLNSSLAAACRLMKPNGLLYIVTPDTFSLSFKLMGSQWWHYKKEHVHYFNGRNLRRLLERYGFMTLGSKPCRKTLSFEYILRQTQSYPVFMLSSLARLIGKFLPARWHGTFITLPSGELQHAACKKT